MAVRLTVQHSISALVFHTHAHTCTGHRGFVEVLAESAQPEGGDVLERTRGNLGRHRTGGVPEDHDSSLQEAGSMRVQRTLSSKLFHLAQL